MAYEFEYSVEVGVSRRAAWAFWTDVANWAFDPAIEWVRLDGAFRAGARGTTKQRGAGEVGWRVTDVQEGEGATIEVELPGAVGRFAWQFEVLAAGKARLTQRITLAGEQADVYAEQMGVGFEQGIREGMRRFCTAMEDAAGVRRA